MSFKIYDASVPVIAHVLGSLSAILAKGEAHAEARKIAPEVFLAARLSPDMHPLTRQVQIACDVSKGTAARLAGIEVPSHPDDEKSFAELQARLTKTIDFIKSIPPTKFDGAETREVTLNPPGRPPMIFTGTNYLFQFGLANIYFHVTTAYDILRHNGVELGKADFLAGAKRA
jgi:hypothetical protein